MDSQILLGTLYLVLGIAFLATRSRMVERGRVLALVWLGLGVLLTANGALRIVQALSG
jgi:hypothetical protein